jgi:large subunit ribosomal protein L10
MLRQEKQAEVAELRTRFSRMLSAVFVDFQGLNVAQVTLMRNRLREAGVEYKVVKNTLARLAIQENAWAKDLDVALTGMTAIAWSYEEPSTAAKVFKAFQKDHDKLKVKAGLVDGKVIDGNTVLTTLATMPGRDELRAMLLATMQAPLQQFVQQLAAPAQNFAYLLSAKKEQGGGAG